MRKNLRNLKMVVVFSLLGFIVEAQKVGNGGGFDTNQTRVIIDRVAFVLKNSLFQSSSPINPEWITALENTKQVFNLHDQAYAAISRYIIVTQSTKLSEKKYTVCLIGTTESFSSILSQNSTGELIKKVSEKLVTLDSLEKSERNQVISDIKRGIESKLISTNCITE
ncbi:MAG: hypothetical protein JNL11_10600 [Bdellovibrionaceae bacterium]|nr:hypothetical protein [Pseudobdellovibrionaceae bacterium]